MRHHILYILAALLAWACTSTEYITLEDKGDQIVICGQWADVDTVHFLYVGKVDKKGIHPLDDATVSLTINGGAPVAGVFQTPIYTVGDTSDDSYYAGYGDAASLSRFAFDCDFVPGDVVKVSAGNAALSASVTVKCPAKPIVVSCDTVHTKQVVSIDYGPEERVMIRLALKDIPSDINYYRLTLFNRYYVDYLHSMVMEPTWLDYSTEPILGGGSQGGTDSMLGDLTGQSNNYCIFDDYSFRDGEYTLHVSYESWDDEDVTNYLYVYSMSFNQFHYLKALGVSSDASFFSEPVSMPCNIEGGLGFLSLDAAAVIKLK